MPFPKTHDELIAAGYIFKNGGHCRGCGQKIQWYQTPKGKVMPLDMDTYEPHWSSCPKADNFRKDRNR